jgi:hypothetical protein
MTADSIARLRASGIHGFLVTEWREIGHGGIPHVAERFLRRAS